MPSSRERFLTTELHHCAHQAFAKLDHVFKVCVGSLGLEHPEFGEMAARLRFFGAKRGPERIYLAERRGGRFHVKLARLREIRLLVVDVIHLKECAWCLRTRQGVKIGASVSV